MNSATVVANEKIVILDFGSQYTELITRKIRELNVYSEVLEFSTQFDLLKDEVERGLIKGIILSGGPSSTFDAEAFTCDPAFFSAGVPVLGICYGMQLISANMPGGHVERSSKHEYGLAKARVTIDHPLTQNIDKELKTWMSHRDKISEAPAGFEVLIETDNTPIAAFANDEKQIYGLQFHPEVNHTEFGRQIISNFVLDICKASANWNMADFIESSCEQISAQVGTEQVLLALSGGVDSSTIAFLLKKAIGDQLVCMFIDHGFMRADEGKELMEIFNEEFGINVMYIDARERFMSKIAGISDPEEKRKRIGNEFIAVFEEESRKIAKANEIKYLAQGTLYPDIIESSGVRIDPKTGKRIAAVIKSHHNVGGLPEDMKFELIEPVKTLFKDEVRALARNLGVPEKIVRRHPFPGPGLAIRILGEVTESKLEIVRHADKIMREELDNFGVYDDIWQALVALLPVRSVGVMGDSRTYGFPMVFRAVTSEDAMTADWAKLPADLLQTISARIINEVPEVNRLVYDITSKPPGTIEWE